MLAVAGWRGRSAWEGARHGEAAAEPARATALTSARGLILPPLESAMDRFFRESEVDWTVENPFSLAAE